MITDYEKLPCSNNADIGCKTCTLHRNGCPVEQPYEVVKAVYKIHTKPKEGANVPELVKAKYPSNYLLIEQLIGWNDLDGVLDFLYGAQELLGVNYNGLIRFIENNCEVVE